MVAQKAGSAACSASLYHVQRAYEYDIVVYQEIGCLPYCNPEQPNQIFTYSCDVICRLIHEGCLRSQGLGHIVKIISGHLSADGFGILFHEDGEVSA